jgi:hypothetical protein
MEHENALNKKRTHCATEHLVIEDDRDHSDHSCAKRGVLLFFLTSKNYTKLISFVFLSQLKTKKVVAWYVVFQNNLKKLCLLMKLL